MHEMQFPSSFFITFSFRLHVQRRGTQTFRRSLTIFFLCVSSLVVSNLPQQFQILFVKSYLFKEDIEYPIDLCLANVIHIYVFRKFVKSVDKSVGQEYEAGFRAQNRM